MFQNFYDDFLQTKFNENLCFSELSQFSLYA